MVEQGSYKMIGSSIISYKMIGSSFISCTMWSKCIGCVTNNQCHSPYGSYRDCGKTAWKKKNIQKITKESDPWASSSLIFQNFLSGTWRIYHSTPVDFNQLHYRSLVHRAIQKYQVNWALWPLKNITQRQATRKRTEYAPQESNSKPERWEAGALTSTTPKLTSPSYF